MFFSASRRLRPLSWDSCRRTYRATSSGSVPAYARSAPPHVSPPPVRIRPGIGGERPADRLANEEVAIGEVGLDVGVQQIQVGLLLERDLADDRNTALPPDVRLA